MIIIAFIDIIINFLRLTALSVVSHCPQQKGDGGGLWIYADHHLRCRHHQWHHHHHQHHHHHCHCCHHHHRPQTSPSWSDTTEWVTGGHLWAVNMEIKEACKYAPPEYLMHTLYTFCSILFANTLGQTFKSLRYAYRHLLPPPTFTVVGFILEISNFSSSLVFHLK